MRGVIVPHRRVSGIERNGGIARQGICADNLQRQPRVLCIIRGPPCCLVTGMRPVNADENGLVVNHDDLLEVIVARIPRTSNNTPRHSVWPVSSAQKEIRVYEKRHIPKDVP